MSSPIRIRLPSKARVKAPAGAPLQVRALPIGSPGNKGDKGDAGDTGASAYQLAVGAGFVGNLAAWLASLVGPKGDKGDKGDAGDTGASAYQHAVGAGFVGDLAAWLASLVGPKGDKGDKGDAGEPPPIEVCNTIADYPASPVAGTLYLVKA